MKNYFLAATLCVSGFVSTAQVCAGLAPQTKSTEALDCSKSSIDYTNHYRHLSSYVPTTATAEKIIHANVIIWQKDDGSTNWQNNPAQLARLNSILATMNSQWLDKNAGPSDPVSGVTELPNLDKKFHVQVEGIYFMQNTAEAQSSYFNGKEQYLQANHPELLKQLNIHIINTPLAVSGAWGWSNGANAQYPAVVTSDDPSGDGYNCTVGSAACPVSTPGNVRDWSFAHHLAHEVGHNVDLLHVYYGGNEPCNTASLDYMDDLFPQNAPYCTNPPSPPAGCNVCVQNNAQNQPPNKDPFYSTNDGWTNNLMNGNEGRYITPKQAGKVHRAFALSNISKVSSGYSSDPINITQNETWDFARQLYRPLVIKAGNTLTVACELRMPEQGTILIEPGAELIIDGGHITKSNVNAGDWWSGIYVGGNSNQAQVESAQGKITIINDGKISYARDAISNVSIDANGGWIWGTMGGIIDAEDAHFVNNRRDVQLLAYVSPGAKNAKYRARFKNCEFKRDDNFLIEHVIQSITMWEVSGIEIEGCTFENTNGGDFEDAGGAIFSINAGYRVHKNGFTGDWCHFEGYADAIRSEGNFSAAFPITIVGATFVDNIHSVYLDGVQGAKVAHNTIEVKANHSFTPPQGTPFQQGAYGIYMNCSNLFALHDNTLTNPDGTNYLSAGIVVNTNSGASDQVYHNTVDGFLHATQALGINHDSSDPDYGLNYICNDFGGSISNAWDIYVEQNGSVARTQGGSSTLPNNRFSLSSGTRNFDNYSTAHTVKYSYGTGDSRVIPTSYINLALLPQSLYSDYPNNCNSLPVPSIVANPGITIGDIQNIEASMVSDIALRQQLIDEGSTPQLEAQILFAADQMDYQNLYVEMMDMSPYVSEENLLNLIWLDGFPELALRNIMVANPHSSRSGAVWDALMDREPALSQQTLDDIEAEQQTITAKDVLDMQIANQQVESEFLSVQLMQFYAENLQENAAYLEDLKTHLQYRDEAYFRYALVDLYLSEKDATNATAALNDIPSECVVEGWESEEYNSMSQYYNTIIPLIDEEGRLDQLDGSAISTLENIAHNGYGIAPGKSRALLILNGVEMIYHEPLIDANGDYKSSPKRDVERPSFVDSGFDLYPNPATDHTILQWDWLEAGIGEGFTISVRSVTGALVKTVIVEDHQVNTKFIHLDGLKPGVYLIAAESEENILFQTKMTVKNQ